MAITALAVRQEYSRRKGATNNKTNHCMSASSSSSHDDKDVSVQRSYWKSARQRHRLKARFEIRQRVLEGADHGTTTRNAHNKNAAASPLVSEQVSVATAENRQKVQGILQRIVKGDRSFFSLTFMEANAEILSTPFPTTYIRLWKDDEDIDNTDEKDKEEMTLVGHVQIFSWFGPQGLQEARRFQQEWSTMSFLEYAIWLHRYGVVGALLLGGTNPCRQSNRSCRQPPSPAEDLVPQDNVDEHDDHDHDDKLFAMGQVVLGRFLHSVPLLLSTYMVKRVVDMRFEGYLLHDDNHRHHHGADQVECQACHQPLSRRWRLCFGAPCHHVFCECCLWNDLLQHFAERNGDVVACPICRSTRATADKSDPVASCLETSPMERRHASLQKYLALPATAKELKKGTAKKRPPHDRDCLQSTWSKAVMPSVGLSQSVRRDKFLTNADRGAHHFVAGCLEAGVDVDVLNDYGQTALFLAVWQGHAKVARLLLEHGSDPNQEAHGGVRVLGVACDQAMISLLEEYGGRRDETTCLKLSINETPTRTTLIASHLEHPGAGSFMIDGGLACSSIDQLIDLHKTLPTAACVKKKTGPCSIRSYYCDTPQVIVRAVESILIRTMIALGQPPVVLMHMRFLSYDEAGAVLPPHVDLCRVLPHPSTLRSTHSFLLYLTDCSHGGETCLLTDLDTKDVLAKVAPQRGRLLVFPHDCPHRGEAVVNVPKLLIRGEVWLPQERCE